MPLKNGSSKKVFEANVKELVHKYKKTGKVGSSKPASMEKARSQALDIAFNKKGGR